MEPNSTKRSVLVVDDDESVRLRVADILAVDSQITVQGAANGREGLELARTLRPDLIFLDIMMPDTDGLSVCRQLRAQPQTREVPIVILSAAPESEFMLQAIELGADDFLKKPIATNELRAKALTITRLNRYRALLGSRAREQWMVDTSPDACMFVNRQGRISFANRQLQELLGIERSRMLGQTLAEALAGRYVIDPPGALEGLEQGRAPQGVLCNLCLPKTSKQSVKWYRVEAFTGEHADEESILLKISDQTRSINQTLQAWSFQEMISHKIRTPLSGLTGMLELMEEIEGVKADIEARNCLTMAVSSSRRLQGTLLDILCYHDAMFSDDSATEAPVPVSTLATDLDRCCRLEGLPQELLGLHQRMETGTMVRGGRAAGVAMVEVVSNYLKFSRAKTTGLNVTLSPEGSERLVISFTAQGADYPDNLLHRLGEPFFQPEANHTGEVPGIGLGLATARALLLSAGGNMRFRKDIQTEGLVTEIVLSCYVDATASAGAAPTRFSARPFPVRSTVGAPSSSMPP